MKTTFFFMFAILFVGALFADTPKTGTIIVKVEGFPNQKGIVFSHLYSEQLADYYPTKSRYSMDKRIGKVEKNIATLVFDNVPHGVYALTVHHDEDENKKMNRNFIGYPTEGFGLSNNPKIFLSIPDFDECKFELKRDTIIINIQLKFV